MDTLVRDLGPVALIIDAILIISNRSALFEDATAENSGTTDSEVSDAGRSIPSYPVYFPSIFGQCGVAEVGGSFRLV